MQDVDVEEVPRSDALQLILGGRAPERDVAALAGAVVQVVTLALLMAAGFRFINVRWRAVPPLTAAGQVIRGKAISAKQSRGTQTEEAKKAMKDKKVQSQCTYTSVGPHPVVKPRYDVLRRGEDGAWSD